MNRSCGEYSTDEWGLIMNLTEFFTNMPKVDLHCHLDGSVRISTILELAAASGLSTDEEFEEIYGDTQHHHRSASLGDYLRKFIYPIKVMQSEKNIYRITYELLEDARNDGIRFLEIRFSPIYHTKEGMSEANAVETVLQAMKDAYEKLNIRSGLILCCMRGEAIEKNMQMIQLANMYKDSGILGVDLAGNENEYPPELYKDVFHKAYESGLNITIHAGEAGIAQNITDSIEMLHAVRIGHGVFAYKNKVIVDSLIKSQIPLELCPCSNLDTGAIGRYEEHPIKEYLKQGINVTLNTDNRTISNIVLTEEYVNLVRYIDLRVEDAVKISMNGILSSFCPDSVKKELRDELKEYCSKTLKILIN